MSAPQWYADGVVVYEPAPVPRFIAACRSPEHAAQVVREHNAHAVMADALRELIAEYDESEFHHRTEGFNMARDALAAIDKAR